MKVDRVARMLAFVDQRSAALLDRPDGWGTPESVELELLLLLEMRHTALGSPEAHVDAVNDRYRAFLDRQRPGTPTSLAARLGLSRRASEEFVALLRQFVADERGILDAEAPPLDGRTPRHYGEA